MPAVWAGVGAETMGRKGNAGTCLAQGASMVRREILGCLVGLAGWITAVSSQVRVIKPVFSRPRYEIVMRSFRVYRAKQWMRPYLNEEISVGRNTEGIVNSDDLAEKLSDPQCKQQTGAPESERN